MADFLNTPQDDDYTLARTTGSTLIKKLKWSTIKSTLKTYFDSLYSAIGHNHSGTYQPAGNYEPANSNIQNHISDSNIHVTTQDKSNWDGKQDELSSGTNIKTINNQPLLGSGNITIEGGTSTPETATSMGALINTATEKTTPVDVDMFSIRDSVSGFLQKLSFSNLKKVLKDYFDTLYNNYTHPATHSASIISQDTNNRFVSDTEKNTWNNKSNFSGAYADLSGKPSFKTINGQSIIGNGDITISEPETATSMGVLINSSSSKGTPVDGDMFAIRDSVTGLLQKIPFLALKGTLKPYFDQFYSYAFKTINGQSIIGNGDIVISGGGTSTPETATSMGVLINTATEKTTPADADMFSIRDSVSGFLQKLSFSSLKTILKTYFDTLYNNYTHPANHPASVITQDSGNRFVSDTEKSTWNGKSNFSGAYADLSGKPTLFDGNYNNLSNKPTIPTALSQLSEDATHKYITEAEKLNIPKNSLVVQDFSQPNISIDFSEYDINEDGDFDANKAITTGNKTITISNPFLNKVVTILLPKISEGTVIILPDSCKKLTGDYSYVLQNIITIHCTKTSPARYLYSISQIQA